MDNDLVVEEEEAADEMAKKKSTTPSSTSTAAPATQPPAQSASAAGPSTGRKVGKVLLILTLVLVVLAGLAVGAFYLYDLVIKPLINKVEDNIPAASVTTSCPTNYKLCNGKCCANIYRVNDTCVCRDEQSDTCNNSYFGSPKLYCCPDANFSKPKLDTNQCCKDDSGTQCQAAQAL